MLINKDQKRRLNLNNQEKEAEQFFFKFTLAFIIFAVVITTFTALNISNVRASNMPGQGNLSNQAVDRADLIISDDMDDYLHKQGHNHLYLLEDLE